MIDLHCHILPEVDDGADSLEESCSMARLALESGVTDIVMTPHCNVPDQFENYAERELLRRMLELQDVFRGQGIPLTLHMGMEVYVTPDLRELLDRHLLLTLGDSHGLLVEFAFDASPRYMERMLGEIRQYGLTPVLAHPERYYCIQDDLHLLQAWSGENVVIQMNKGSFFGMFGRHAARTAHQALDMGCIHLVGSDAHSSRVRTTRMSEIRAYLSELTSDESTELLLETNPRRVLTDEYVRPLWAEF